ncbi:DNA-binding transcriptional regulator, MerR family [Jatrophihabitans endophyticus]|uniref:DNA-binding transcriptional regulator, MerR family n=1 Tax=Jatrophihabitans endophyticus TaxID=1206085 RepID=A0A1M5MR61_9ACTN|nr:MerR family transcriptional regulator [Jatrophihabitans endophyticus]SHG79910.1 DNA-binding transcriptional regulator, MerR family [Jatrophihabitans endophyticus]
MTSLSAAAGGTSPNQSATLTIGDVLASLKVDFPDLTISKIRFLESEGLVQPQRTPSGYRKFAAGDVARLRYVLSQQRDHYLPLRVIKEQLDAIDRGLVPPGTSTDSPRPAHVALATIADNAPTADHFRAAPAAIRMSREELLNAAGLRSEQLRELEQFGLIKSQPGGHYDDDALAVAKIVADLAHFGLEGRHLRAFRTAAEREVGLFAQVVGPTGRQRGGEAKARAEETVRELAALSVRLHAALVQIGLREVTGGS